MAITRLYQDPFVVLPKVSCCCFDWSFLTHNPFHFLVCLPMYLLVQEMLMTHRPALTGLSSNPPTGTEVCEVRTLTHVSQRQRNTLSAADVFFLLLFFYSTTFCLKCYLSLKMPCPQWAQWWLWPYIRVFPVVVKCIWEIPVGLSKLDWAVFGRSKLEWAVFERS